MTYSSSKEFKVAFWRCDVSVNNLVRSRALVWRLFLVILSDNLTKINFRVQFKDIRPYVNVPNYVF